MPDELNQPGSAAQATGAARDERLDVRDALEVDRRCPECGAKLTVQILPHGYESHCTPCERRARFEKAGAGS
jgi:uncharacterized paraquat-inducible protein A